MYKFFRTFKKFSKDIFSIFQVFHLLKDLCPSGDRHILTDLSVGTVQKHPEYFLKVTLPSLLRNSFFYGERHNFEDSFFQNPKIFRRARNNKTTNFSWNPMIFNAKFEDVKKLWAQLDVFFINIKIYFEGVHN